MYIEPNNIKELFGIKKYIDILNNWHNNLNNKYLFMLIDGNYGIGKTTLAQLFLKDKNYSVKYFDMSFEKNKQTIINSISKSLNKFDIQSYFTSKPKNFAFIIDNISNILYKNDIIELHNMFINNNNNIPVIFIGKYDKTVNFPKKKIDYMKIYNPSNIILNNIAKNIINNNNLNISQINLKLIISKSQYDIRKLIILLLNNTNTNNILDYQKDIDFNLFNIFTNLINIYTKINFDINYDYSVIINYLFHQNLFNILLCNFNNKHIKKYSYLFYNRIYTMLSYNKKYYDDYYFKQYLYINVCKYISFYYNKKKTHKNMSNIKIEYPKYSYIINQQNIYKKYIILFKDFDFYNILDESNFILFCQSIFYDEENNLDIINKLNKNDIISLKKLI